MSKTVHTSNYDFKKFVAKTPKNKILGVTFDTSKEFHQVLIADFNGKILKQAYPVGTLKKDYETLKKEIKKQARRIKAERIYIAFESPAKFAENFVQQMRIDFENICFISCLKVARNREQRSLAGLKTDSVDCGSVFDLLVRGEFNSDHNLTPAQYKLRSLIHLRNSRIKLISMTKNQMFFLFERIYPGLNSTFDGNKKVFISLYNSFIHKGLLHGHKTGQSILKEKDSDLIDEFNYSWAIVGEKHIKRLKVRLKEMLLPQEEISEIDLDALRRCVDLYDFMVDQVEIIENEIIEIGEKTEAKYLYGQIPGLSNIMAAIYVGLVGNFDLFDSAEKVYSYTGLSPKRKQSGGTDRKSLGITRAGNRLLRCQLFLIARQVSFNDLHYKESFKKHRANGKSYKETLIVMAKKLNKTMYALIRDKSQYKTLEPLEVHKHV